MSPTNVTTTRVHKANAIIVPGSRQGQAVQQRQAIKQRSRQGEREDGPAGKWTRLAATIARP